ncbi:MAG: hypothetical protein NC393_09530 [Clostridium sp.]|nr:hypothetical protein [Clostridium sp.]
MKILALKENQLYNELLGDLQCDRYKKARQIIMNNEDIENIHINGGCRAYLDAFSDYMNPVLTEMDKAENMLMSNFPN